MQLSISQLRLDGGTQPRAQLDLITIAEYADAMRAGAQFPAVTVFYDGEFYWLADGYHRVRAAEANGDGLATVEADVRQGSRRDAILFSASANVTHGLRRTNADKRRAVVALLSDPEWASWSDNEIARRCAVSPGLVGPLRSEIGRDAETGRGAVSAPVSAPSSEVPAPPSMHAAKIDDAGFIGTPAEIAALERRKSTPPAPSVAGQDLPAARRTEKAATAERTVKRAGRTYQMKTAQIGKKKIKPVAKIAREAARAQIAGHPVVVTTSVAQDATGVCPECHEQPATYNLLEEGGYECGSCGARVSLNVIASAEGAKQSQPAKTKTCRKCGKPVSGKICAHCGAVSR